MEQGRSSLLSHASSRCCLQRARSVCSDSRLPLLVVFCRAEHLRVFETVCPSVMAELSDNSFRSSDTAVRRIKGWSKSCKQGCPATGVHLPQYLPLGCFGRVSNESIGTRLFSLLEAWVRMKESKHGYCVISFHIKHLPAMRQLLRDGTLEQRS